MKFEWKAKTKVFRLFCRENRREVFLLCLGAIILLALQLAADLAGTERYIVDDRGRLTAVRREAEEEMSLPLHVRLEKDGLETEENVTVYLSGEEAENLSEEKETDPLQELKDGLEELLSEIEGSSDAVIKLPGHLSDGTKITWTRQKDLSAAGCILLIPLGLFFLYRSRTEKEKQEREKQVSSVSRGLPGFNDQLLLLMNSGLIFSDAFTRIAEGRAGRKEKDDFSAILEDMLRRSRETGSSLISAMESCARGLGIREFSRLTGILADNQYKGVDLAGKLEAESEILWNQRKKTAEEKGRAAETKLSFPLAVLLLVLILVTAAPAILQM